MSRSLRAVAARYTVSQRGTQCRSAVHDVSSRYTASAQARRDVTAARGHVTCKTHCDVQSSMGLTRYHKPRSRIERRAASVWATKRGPRRSWYSPVLARSRCHETSATDAGCCILHNRTVARGRFTLVAQRLSGSLDPAAVGREINGSRNSATRQARASRHQTASSVLASGTAISPMAGALNAALSRELGRDHTAAPGRLVPHLRTAPNLIIL